MNFTEGALYGCKVAIAPVVHDRRGSFSKPFSLDEYRGNQLPFAIHELYWSRSQPRTLRGMHFQAPPYAHWKLVWCAAGEIIDVVLDLRVGSPTFMATDAFRLTSDSGRAVVIPPGLAHGFYVPDTDAVVIYAVSSAYHPEHDKGVLWHTIGFDWPTANPIVSDRDMSLPALHDFVSPFVFESHEGGGGAMRSTGR